MKINQVEFYKSSFLTAEKDLFNIVDKLLSNENLKRLLYYPTRDALDKPPLTQDETTAMIHKNIRVVPRLKIDETVESYIIISFDDFMTNENNPEFRDNLIIFDVICHIDTWAMQNYQIRPYKIMGEIDGMLNGKKLNGFGTVEFINAKQIVLNSELAGYTIMYRVVNDV